MTAPDIERDDEEIIAEHLAGGRPASAQVHWRPDDKFTAKANDWGTERDPWVERVAGFLYDHARRALGVSTTEVLAHLGASQAVRSERELQAARVHVGLVLRSVGWAPRLTPGKPGEKRERRYFPTAAAGGPDQNSPPSPHGKVPGIASPPGGASPPKNSGVDWSDPTTWPLMRKGLPGEQDWVRDRQGNIVRRPLSPTPPNARLSSLLRQRSELAQAMARIDAEIAKQGGMQR